MKKRTFGDVLADFDGGQSGIFLYTSNNLSVRKAEDLVENLRDALAWIRDQQRREKEEQTPELPL